MMWQSFIIFLPSILAGFGLVHLVWRSYSNAWALALKFFLGVGLGLGITSCLYFFRLVLFPAQDGYLLIGFGFLGVILFALFVQGRLSLDFSIRFTSFSWFRFFFLVVAILVVMYNAISCSLALIRNSPHGDYDAQAIWNMRARFIYRSGENWESAFSPEINRDFHMDYPLLIPLNVSGGWNALGGEVLRIPAIQSMLFLYGAAGVLFCLVAYRRTSLQAVLALAILLATPLLMLFASFQTADIAVAYYFLSTGSLLVLSFNDEEPRLLFLAGMMSALSAWAKNEGIPFMLITVLFTTIILFKQNRFARIRYFLAGTIIPIATIVLFKIHLPVSQSNDLFTGNALTVILSKILDPTRYISIFKHLASELIHLGDWHMSIVIILAIYGWIVGIKKSYEDSMVSRWIIILPLLQLAVYFGIYLVTPFDLVWHMNYSMSRLLIHLFPMALLWFFLIVNTPEDALELDPAIGQNVQRTNA